ncbi:homocitrate synthase/isopropylmalate synthase family protein, partial [Bacillus safensis]
TAAGIHQQGMLNDPDTYEYVKPDVLGRERQILVTRHSGRTIIRHLLQDLDIPHGENVINYLYEKFISSQHSSTCDDLTTFKNKIQNELKIQSEMEVAQ